MIILSLILFFIVLGWDLRSDYKKWKEGVHVKHTKEALTRGLLLIPAISLLVVPKVINTSFWYFLWVSTVSVGLYGSLWWELFDGIYNKLRGFKWRFNGSVDSDDSKLDRFLYKIGDFWEGVMKVGLILLFLILYITT